MHTGLPILLTTGSAVAVSLFAGKLTSRLKLPSLIGFMLVGIVAGPSLLDLLDESTQTALSFVTQIALAFVAVSIGLELSLSSLKKQGTSIIAVIIAESLGAFVLVTLAVYLLTRNLPLALIFGAIAPASAPAGTVAVIHEYRARGPLTRALYAVVGFDDGLGIIIFGFSAAISRALLAGQTGQNDMHLLEVLSAPVVETIGGLMLGLIMALVFCFLARKLSSAQDIFILLFGIVLATTGLCAQFHLSVILTNMVLGLVVVNTQPHAFVQQVGEQLRNVLPLLFVLFFTLAGSSLHLQALPQLGLLGLVYIVSRSTGLIVGSRVGAVMGKAGDTIRKYLGLGILSQAGVAIGLSLIVKQEFAGLGRIEASGVTAGDLIGGAVITTITATCVVFEIIGPILTRIALRKANEISGD